MIHQPPAARRGRRPTRNPGGDPVHAPAPEQIYVEHTGQPIEKIELTGARSLMNAVDAKTYGLIDEVLDKRAGDTVKSA